MQYYNPSTQMVISKQDLKALLHASIPEGIEEIGGWHRLYNGQAPETQPGQSIAPGPIELIDGRYTQTWVATGTVETVRAAMLEELTKAHIDAEEAGTIQSTAAGFEIDATPRAKRDIDGLVEFLEATSQAETMFCGADNQLHPVTLAQVKAMQLELVEYAQLLYGRKWELRAAINAAQTLEELAAIDINFNDLT